MKSKTSYLKICTEKKKEMINITDEVQKVVDESGIKEGLCLVNSMHITSSIFINEWYTKFTGPNHLKRIWKDYLSMNKEKSGTFSNNYEITLMLEILSKLGS